MICTHFFLFHRERAIDVGMVTDCDDPRRWIQSQIVLFPEVGILLTCSTHTKITYLLNAAPISYGDLTVILKKDMMRLSENKRMKKK